MMNQIRVAIYSYKRSVNKKRDSLSILCQISTHIIYNNSADQIRSDGLESLLRSHATRNSADQKA